MVISFENKVALVTGTASGLRLTTAKALAESRAPVVLADRNEEAAQAAANDLAAQGHKTLAIRSHISEDEHVEATVKETVATFGRVDAACNNAGFEMFLRKGPIPPAKTKTR